MKKILALTMSISLLICSFGLLSSSATTVEGKWYSSKKQPECICEYHRPLFETSLLVIGGVLIIFNFINGRRVRILLDPRGANVFENNLLRTVKDAGMEAVKAAIDNKSLILNAAGDAAVELVKGASRAALVSAGSTIQ